MLATTILAGMLCGTLMGLIASAHVAILLTARPPEWLRRRLAEGRSGNLVSAMVFGVTAMWLLAGIAASLLAGALLRDVTEYAAMPSSEYLVAVVAAIVVFGGIAAFVLRERWMHVALSSLLALGIFGALVPNLVIAMQNRG